MQTYRMVDRVLEAKARDLAGLKGYVTNLAACPDGTPATADLVIGKSFRMTEHDLQARPALKCALIWPNSGYS